jgi:hypothetical protein
VGELAPPLELRDLDGRLHRLSDERGRVVVLNFWASDCPWSERSDPGVLAAVRSSGEGVTYWPVASNADEDLQRAHAAVRVRGLPLILLDNDQSIADQYGAATTPFVAVIDAEGVLRYRGAPDDADFRRRHPTRSYLAEALTRLQDGRPPEVAETPGRGCALVRRYRREAQ